MTPGDLHNSLVSNYLNNKSSDPQDFQDMFADYYDLSTKKYPELKDDNAANSFLNTYKAGFDMEKIREDMESRLKSLLDNNQISDYLYSKLINVIEANNIDNVYSVINEVENNLNLLSDDEIERFETFKSIFLSSQNLWSSYYNQRGGGDGNGGGAIIADAIGGFIWWELGPFGVLIAGGYSLAGYYS